MLVIKLSLSVTDTPVNAFLNVFTVSFVPVLNSFGVYLHTSICRQGALPLPLSMHGSV